MTSHNDFEVILDGIGDIISRVKQEFLLNEAFEILTHVFEAMDMDASDCMKELYVLSMITPESPVVLSEHPIALFLTGVTSVVMYLGPTIHFPDLAKRYLTVLEEYYGVE